MTAAGCDIVEAVCHQTYLGQNNQINQLVCRNHFDCWTGLIDLSDFPNRFKSLRITPRCMFRRRLTSSGAVELADCTSFSSVMQSARIALPGTGQHKRAKRRNRYLLNNENPPEEHSWKHRKETKRSKSLNPGKKFQMLPDRFWILLLARKFLELSKI